MPPRETPGAWVGDDDIDAVLRALPGLDGPDPAVVAPVRDAFGPALAVARTLRDSWRRSEDRLAGICDELRLDDEDVDVLCVVAAVEKSPSRQRLLAYVQDGVGLVRPTLAFVATAFPFPHRGARVLSPDGPVVGSGVVRLHEGRTWALTSAALSARASWALAGDDSLDPLLPHDAVVLPRAGPDQRSGPEPGTPATRFGSDREEVVVLLCGGDVPSRRATAAALRPDRPVVASSLPRDEEQWSALVCEATVRRASLVIEPPHELDALARRHLMRARHLPRIISTEHELPLDCLPPVAWTEMHLGSSEAPARGSLTVGSSSSTPPPVHRLAGGHLSGLAVRVAPDRTWSDLVVPEEQLERLQGLVSRHGLREVVYGSWGFTPYPSVGTVALFAGPSGTGKTLAAEVVAGALGLDLYKVDLSGIVSKYIGETEKQLDRVFRAASVGEIVLFFDEADALFGKRSEVNDAHDRYANIGVAFLLQRLEQHDGMVVLATNLHHNIDPAFLRRVAVTVDFSPPEEAQRRRLWELAFPPPSLQSPLDLDDLATTHAVTGGVIHNAARSAAFLAARDGTLITEHHVASALRTELQKLGRLPHHPDPVGQARRPSPLR